MFSGFQSNFGQYNAFQILQGATVAPLIPNGNRLREYQPYSYELNDRKDDARRLALLQREAELDIAEGQRKIEALELRRLRDLADEAMQLELLALLKEQQQLQLLLADLQQKRAMVLRLDDDFLVIMMCLPFNA